MPNEIKIEKGVPLPRERNKFPMGTLKVGESFEIENRPHIRSYFYTASKRHGIKITMRTLPNGNFRVWRIA